MKTVMLAVSGLSPQVITETLYVLHQSSRHVDAIHVITTRDGKEKIFAELFGGGDGHYYKYLDEYSINPASIDFGHRNVHVITNEYGIELSDIESESDNEQLLKKCMEMTFYFTKGTETAVFFSIAGGRKTMSSCLSLAAQMYGRPQDRLYHVLVSPEFESNRNFFYPPKKSQAIELRDNQGQPFFKETKFARINLIHIPFVSIRDNLPGDILKEPKDAGTLALSLIREEISRLTVNLISGKIVYKKIELDMMPAHLALYAFFAMQKKNCSKEVNNCGSCIDCFLNIHSIYENQEEINDLYKRISGSRPLNEMSDTGITGLSSDNFNTYKAKIKANLLCRFGPYALKKLEIASKGSRPNTRYGIIMDKARIEIVY